MYSARIHHVHHFSAAQKANYTQKTHTLSLVCSGFRQFSINGIEVNGVNKSLIFSPALSTTEFHAGHDRENWVISFDSEDFRAGPDPHSFELFFEQQWLSLPRHVPIPHEHVSGWRGECIRIRDSFLKPLPLDQLRVQLGLSNMLRYFVAREPDRYTLSPASRLKGLIDQDLGYLQSIGQLSAGLGLSADHLRLLFKQQYAMTPSAYRQQRRMAQALDLIANSDLSIQEVSHQCGFQQLSHFSANFRNSFKQSPREALKKFRAHSYSPHGKRGISP